MKTKSAKSGNSSLRYEPTKSNNVISKTPTSRINDTANEPETVSSRSATPSTIHHDVCEALRKQKTWITKAQLLELETEGKPMPSRVFDCLE